MSVVFPQPPFQLQKARDEIRGMLIDCNRELIAVSLLSMMVWARLNRQLSLTAIMDEVTILAFLGDPPKQTFQVSTEFLRSC